MRDSYYNVLSYKGDLQLDLLSSTFKDFKNYIKRRMIRVITINEDMENNADLISYKFYGTSNWWWLICYVNNITDPFTELTRGTEIVIPDLSDISNYIQTKDSNSSLNTISEV
jgi:hypothetical protein